MAEVMSESYQPAETFGRGSTQHQLNGDNAGSSDDVTFFASFFGSEEGPWSQRQQAISPASRLQHAPAAQGQVGEHQGMQQGQDLRQQSQGLAQVQQQHQQDRNLRQLLGQVGLQQQSMQQAEAAMVRQKLLQQQQQALLDERESQLVLREQQLLRHEQLLRQEQVLRQQLKLHSAGQGPQAAPSNNRGTAMGAALSPLASPFSVATFSTDDSMLKQQQDGRWPQASPRPGQGSGPVCSPPPPEPIQSLLPRSRTSPHPQDSPKLLPELFDERIVASMAGLYDAEIGEEAGLMGASEPGDQSSLIRRHQSASSLSLLDMDLRSQRSMPLKGRQGREAALKAALHTPHHSSMLALPPSSVSMAGMAPAGSANPVDAKQEGPGKAAATATAVATGAANSPRLMQALLNVPSSWQNTNSSSTSGSSPSHKSHSSCSGAGGPSVLNGLLNHSFMMHDPSDLPAATHAAPDYPQSPMPHTNLFSASVPDLADWAEPLRQAAPTRALFPLKLGDLLPKQTASAGLLPGSGAIRGSVSLGDLRRHSTTDRKPQVQCSSRADMRPMYRAKSVKRPGRGTCRKRIVDKRPRIKGRFVKPEELAAYLGQHQSEGTQQHSPAAQAPAAQAGSMDEVDPSPDNGSEDLF